MNSNNERISASIRTILVANRGEVAVRIVRTCRAMGLRTVAVFGEADATSPHVACADEAVAIGGVRAQDSYLRVDKIVRAARNVGADAIHPGYGFLAESAALAEAAAEAGLIFIGPSPQTMVSMGAKDSAKDCARRAGVPCIPGCRGEYDDWQSVARDVGFPVMLKAVHGGGGRGMRLVRNESELAVAVAAAEREAVASFGRGELLLEKALLDARHIEVQVLGDIDGNIVHLGERDCSLQRRYQKIIEECPSPFIDDTLRSAITDAAIAIAREADYVGVGTVEYLVTEDGAFYFLEMNTRLQVEHGVTEAVYGVDLVEWQIRVAQGQRLPWSQSEIDSHCRGWAIEARLCAEDPERRFLPQCGTVSVWAPPTGDGIRIDHCLESGLTISPFYDSLLAKFIACSDTREQARLKLEGALAQTRLEGIKHNGGFLRRVLAAAPFTRGEYTTALLGQLLYEDIGNGKSDVA